MRTEEIGFGSRLTLRSLLTLKMNLNKRKQPSRYETPDRELRESVQQPSTIWGAPSERLMLGPFDWLRLCRCCGIKRMLARASYCLFSSPVLSTATVS